MKTVYLCGDTLTGLFSALYDAWKAALAGRACGIAVKGEVELQLFCDYVEVEETERKAEAVITLIKKHLGAYAYQEISQAALSYDPDKGEAILGTMLAARTIPDSRKIMDHLSHPRVEKVFELSRQVGCEAHHLKGFLRFRELAGGILCARIRPKSQVLPCLAPHFTDRLPLENWMIWDETHNMFAVHEASKQWVLVWGEAFEWEKLARVSDREREFARLWTGFCKTIAIDARRNPRCQRQNLPLRFRPEMTEFQEWDPGSGCMFPEAGV